MTNIKLELPNVKYCKSFLETMREFQEFKNWITYSDRKYDDFDLNMTEKEFEEKIVVPYLNWSKWIDLPEWYVTWTDFWIIDEDWYAGRMNLRNELTEELLIEWWNIGYDVRPSKRRKWYAKTALRLALEKAKEVWLEKVLITCNEINEASKKTILSVMNEYWGFQDESSLSSEYDATVLRFWVNTTKKN